MGYGVVEWVGYGLVVGCVVGYGIVVGCVVGYGVVVGWSGWGMVDG